MHMSHSVLAVLLAAAATQAPAANLYYDATIPQARFAAGEIRRALALKSVPLVEAELTHATDAAPSSVTDTRFILACTEDQSRRLAAALRVAPPKPGAPQSYAIRKQAATYAVLANDAAGAMYGGLDLAEAIRLGTVASLADSDHQPYIAQRGIKFNIPLDVRTPSYSDAGDSAQQNIPEMWSFDFWREFLDEMARHRFNVLSLWNLHPFPSMVKVPEYPDIALDDVMRTTVKFDDTFSTSGKDMLRPAMLEHLETVKKISIGEKIQFWRDVMQYAHDRGIGVYIFTWNTFVFGTGGKHGITAANDNLTTIDYFRKSVREMVLTYPLLAGFGITAGENMQNRKDDFSNEKWLWKTYGLGIADAKKLQPDRRVRLIHRFHQTDQSEILDAFKDYPDQLDFSYKYSVAHMYSSPAPIFARQTLQQLPPNLRTWMTVRNDDIFSFRWGDPAYARAYIHNLPGPDKLAGYYMGPDGYIWGREFISTDPDTPRELVMKKQWFSFMLWGRLSYDPALPDDLFERSLAQRFPEVPAGKLLEASLRASRIIPQITRFFWGDIDIKWFPEACFHHPSKFYDVRDFVKGESMPGAGVMNIATYVKRLAANQLGANQPPLTKTDEITPLQVAEQLHADAGAALRLVGELRPGPSAAVKSQELRFTLGDYEAMAHLGDYYAEKILGATDLALGHKEPAVRHLEAALEHWKKYAAVATAHYKPQLLTRVGFVDLIAITASVAKDVEIARTW
jgi:hypothetical protein